MDFGLGGKSGGKTGDGGEGFGQREEKRREKGREREEEEKEGKRARESRPGRFATEWSKTPGKYGGRGGWVTWTVGGKLYGADSDGGDGQLYLGDGAHYVAELNAHVHLCCGPT